MDTMTAVAIVLSVAAEHKDVDILKEINDFNKDDIVATELKSAKNSWKITFGTKCLILKQECNIITVGSQEIYVDHESLVDHHHLCPAFAPQPYCWSAQHKASLLEYVGDYSTLSDEISASHVDMEAIKKIGSTLGLLHKLSHSASNSLVVRNLLKKFITNPVIDQMVQTVFVDTFDQPRVEGLSNEVIKKELSKIISDRNSMDRVASLKNTVLHRRECLSHALISTASFGIKDGDVKLMNGLNGTFMGPCSFDIAALLADYIAFYHQHMLTEQDNDAHRQVAYKMVDACTQTVDAYLEQMTIAVDGREQYVSSLLSDVAGLCGIILIARVVQRSFECREALSKGVETLQSGARLLGASHRIHDASLLVNIALMLTH